MNTNTIDTINTVSKGVSDLIELAICAVVIYATWRMYEKMKIEGWKSLIPFYGQYVLYERIYGDGWMFLYTLIPFYGVFVTTRMYGQLSRGFKKGPGFIIGLSLVHNIFICILGFDSVEFDDNYDLENNDKYEKTANTLSIVMCVLAVISIIACVAMFGLIYMFIMSYYA